MGTLSDAIRDIEQAIADLPPLDGDTRYWDVYQVSRATPFGTDANFCHSKEEVEETIHEWLTPLSRPKVTQRRGDGFTVEDDGWAWFRVFVLTAQDQRDRWEVRS